ncbi:MAG: hypothetical protein ABSE51_06850 [Terracidiphilus sp.]
MTQKEDAVACAIEVAVAVLTHNKVGIGVDFERAMHQLKETRHTNIDVFSIARHNL